MKDKQHSGQHMPASAEKAMLFPVLFAAILILAGLAMCIRYFSDPFPRVEVGDFRISQEEYLQAMYQARNDVLSDHAAAGISLTDWDAETALGDPKRLTMERALEILNEYYAVSTLAYERGYLADASYEAMKRDLEEINSKRQEALDSGSVITGFTSFTMADYISYRASGIRLQFCNDPENPEYQVTQEQIRGRYEADRDHLYQQPDSIELHFLEIDGADDALAEAVESLREMTLERGDLALAMEDFPELKAYYQEISVQPGNYGFYERAYGDVLVCAETLQTGDLSRVFRQEDWLCLIQCRQRIAHQYVPLEEVESVVVQSIRESRYEALLAERMENTQIRGDLESLYRFTAQQLP